MVAPVDMRRGIDGLSVLVEQALQRSPCSGSAFVFCYRAGSRIKVLLWDGTGVWLCQRRLHRGRFVWRRSDTGGMELTSSQWEWLIAGVELSLFEEDWQTDISAVEAEIEQLLSIAPQKPT